MATVRGASSDNFAAFLLAVVVAMCCAALIFRACDERAHCIEWKQGELYKVTNCLVWTNHVCTYSEERMATDKVCVRRDDR